MDTIFVRLPVFGAVRSAANQCQVPSGRFSDVVSLLAEVRPGLPDPPVRRQ